MRTEHRSKEQKSGSSRPGGSRSALPSTSASSAALPSNAASTSLLPEKHKPQALQFRTQDGLPGLSKLKSQIRQTKRMLAKEGIEPGLKVQTQRRLTSLELDLARAQRRDVEMKNGSKYHKIKFFERQKLTRIIKRLQRSSEKGKEAETPESAADLERARIMLHYVLQYPNTEKYISLFPPSSDSSASKDRLDLPPYLSNADGEPSISLDELDKPSRRRLELLIRIRDLMRAGQLSRTPEADRADGNRVDLLEGTGRNGGAATPVAGDRTGASISSGTEEVSRTLKRTKDGAGTETGEETGGIAKRKSKGGGGEVITPVQQLADDEDDFFEA